MSAKSNRRRDAAWRGSREGVGWLPVALAALLALALAGAGALLAVRGGAAEDAPVADGLVLNEVMSDNASALVDEAGGVPDWIELRNAGSEPVELKGCALVRGVEYNKLFSFPEGRLEPGACVVVYCEGMDAGATHGDWSAPFRLNASGGEELTLLSPGDEVLDAVTLPELNENEAYARNAQGEWERRPGGTPGRDNGSAATAAEAPELQLYPAAVELSEVCPDDTLYFPDEYGEHHGYVELHNASAADVDLSGWHLSDDRGKLLRWSFPRAILPAGGYLAVHCSGYDRREDAGHLHTDFRIGGGEGVYLCDPDGRLVSMATPPELESDLAWSLVDGAWSAELPPTPGAPNSGEDAARVNAAAFAGATVHINELMASTGTEDPDWLELYNASAADVDLSGCGLSDNPARPRKWQFSQGARIPAGGYLRVSLGEAREGDVSADFALSAEGGYTVTLSDPSGNVLDAAFLPRQYSGLSYGRAQGEDGFFYFESATPAAANGGAHYRSRAEAARCSVEGGLYAAGQSFSVELSAPAGSRIHYTLDASDPSEASALYTAPIPVSGSTVLRTRVYRDGCLPSLIDTQSYLFDVRNESGVYVVSVVTDPANLTGPNGIATADNLMQHIEREGHVEIFTPDGARVVTQGCGISLHGGSSRRLPVKSLNLLARSTYGANRFNYPIFSERDYSAYQSLLLRPSGEDQDMSMMRDSVLSSLMRGSSVMYQENEICVQYLNGEYYSLCYIRERINKYSICQFEGWEGMEDEIDIVEGNEAVSQGSNASFAELLKWIKANRDALDTDAAYERIAAEIDVENYIEYMSAQIFVGNLDTLNVRRYRNKNADGRWRWALYDLDWGFYHDTDTVRRWLEPAGMGVGEATDNTLFIGCMLNPRFRDEFLTYFGEQLATTFSTQSVLPRFEERYRRIEPMLEQYTAKWSYNLTPGIRKVVDYAKTRPEKIIGYAQVQLKLSDADMQKYFGAALQRIQEYKEANG